MADILDGFEPYNATEFANVVDDLLSRPDADLLTTVVRRLIVTAGQVFAARICPGCGCDVRFRAGPAGRSGNLVCTGCLAGALQVPGDIADRLIAARVGGAFRGDATWICRNCGERVGFQYARCPHPKPSKQVGSGESDKCNARQPPKLQPDQWSCERCGTWNEYPVGVCACCGSGPPAGWAPRHACPECGQWSAGPEPIADPRTDCPRCSSGVTDRCRPSTPAGKREVARALLKYADRQEREADGGDR